MRCNTQLALCVCVCVLWHGRLASHAAFPPWTPTTAARTASQPVFTEVARSRRQLDQMAIVLYTKPIGYISTIHACCGPYRPFIIARWTQTTTTKSSLCSGDKHALCRSTQQGCGKKGVPPAVASSQMVVR